MDNQIDRYLIKREIASGGMATVYLADDPQTGREVALKILPAQNSRLHSFRDRFSREARTIMALEHPAIVPVYDFGEHQGQPYLVMRFMAGGSLAQRLQYGPLNLVQAAKIFHRLASALDYIHQLGIVHRDLKPGNILFDSSGNAYLADFGIARLLDETMTLTAVGLMGTPAYMSPEQIQALVEIDGRSDIYALGVMLFEILAGRHPFQADTPFGLAYAHVNQPAPTLMVETIPSRKQVNIIIQRALAKDREERFQTAAAMEQAILRLIPAAERSSHGLPQVGEHPPWPFLERSLLRRPGLIAWMLLLLIPAVVGAAWWTGGRANDSSLVNLNLLSPQETVQAKAQIEGQDLSGETANPLPTRVQIGTMQLGNNPKRLAVFRNEVVLAKEPVEIQIDHQNAALENANLYGFAGSEIEFKFVDRRIEFDLFSGSEMFFQTGSFAEGAIVNLEGTNLSFAVTGSCMAVDFRRPDRVSMGCFEGSCFYRQGQGVSQPLEIGWWITFDLERPAAPPEYSAADQQSIDHYQTLLALSPSGRRDQEKCLDAIVLRATQPDQSDSQGEQPADQAEIVAPSPEMASTPEAVPLATATNRATPRPAETAAVLTSPTSPPIIVTTAAPPATATRRPTRTPRPPTSTAAVPTSTPRPPTPTQLPPTATSRPPTPTRLPPTATSRPPTPTQRPPTATPRPPTPTSAPPKTEVPPTNTPQISSTQPPPTSTPFPVPTRSCSPEEINCQEP